MALVVESFELTAPRHRSSWENLQSALLLALTLVHPQLLAVVLLLLNCSLCFLGSLGRSVKGAVHEAAS